MSASPSESDLKLAIEEVESALVKLKQRYAQVQQDQAEYAEALNKKQGLKQQLRQDKHRSFQTELNLLQQQIEQLELNLESRLLNWEPFWQAVRFGGIGVVVGWLLKTWGN